MPWHPPGMTAPYPYPEDDALAAEAWFEQQQLDWEEQAAWNESMARAHEDGWFYDDDRDGDSGLYP